MVKETLAAEPASLSLRAASPLGEPSQRSALAAAMEAATGSVSPSLWSDDFLFDIVAPFLGAGLAAGEGVIVFAAGDRLLAFRERLHRNCFDVDRACSSGQLALFDAFDTLEKFMVDGRPDPDRFVATVAPLVEASRRGHHGLVRAYGEMVDVLWSQKNHQAAVDLDQLWSRLSLRLSISRLCGYSVRTSSNECAGSFVRQAGADHPECVLPDVTEADAHGRQRLALQQRLRALENDIERRKSVELAIRQREAELADFLDNAVEGIHWVGRDGTILWANRAEFEMMGYSEREYVGRHIADFHVDRAVIDGVLDRLTRGETLRGIEARLRTKDGSIRDVLISSNAYRRDGKFVYTRCFTRDITDRKRTENDLRQTAQRLKAVLEQMPSAVAIVEAPSGKLLLANDQNEAIFRQPNVPLDGISAYRRFSGFHDDGREIQPHDWPLSRSIVSGEIVKGEELQIVRADGSHACIRANSAPIRDPSGSIVAGVVTYEDVTEEKEHRRITETLLRVSTLLTSELNLDALMQKLTDEATGLCRAEFGSFFYNVIDDTGESYMLYTLSGAHRETFEKFPMPRNTALFDATFSGSGVVRVDDVKQDPRYGKNPPHHGMPAGHLPVTSYLAVPVKSRNGEVLGGLFFGHQKPGVFTAADERLLTAVSMNAAIAIENARLFRGARRAERLAQAERQRLHDLFMQAPASIWILRGPNHVIEFANPVALELFPGRALVGKKLEEAMPSRDLDRVRELDRVFRTGKSFRATELSATMDWQGNGQPYQRFFNVAYEPFRDEYGAIAGVTTFSFEVTEQVLARRRIEGMVEELEKANRTKDDFLATVSHELRTPLNAMLGWTRMLRSGLVDEARREKALETIERNAHAQTQLIEDLLDVSRIISGKMRLDVKVVDTSVVVANAVEAVRPAADAKGVNVSQRVDPTAGPVWGDADRLQQVVWNLLSNAVKFTPAGGSVQVAVEKRDAFVEVVVSDNGQGIEPAFLPHVFEKFRQADPKMTRKHMGLGLGLAIVRHLVELHGGQVSVDSEGLGKGATFVVRLPISVRPASVPPPSDNRGATPTPRAYPRELAGSHILVIEDDEDARALLVQVLEPCKARVSTAGNVPEGLQLVEQTRPDVIVSDIGLPGEDGYAFIKKLRALPPGRGGSTPAVALTAYARVEDRTKALVAGFNMHVPKPVEPEELIAVLSSLSTMFPPR